MTRTMIALTPIALMALAACTPSGTDYSDVLPDDPLDRHLDELDVPVFTSALHRMLMAFDKGGREEAPKDSAEAQVAYDCWIEAAEYDREDDIQRCREAFWDAMKAVSDAADYELTEMPASMAPQVAAVAPALEGYLVYFEWDSTAVTPAGPTSATSSAWTGFYLWTLDRSKGRRPRDRCA